MNETSRLIIGFDTSGPYCSAALWRDEICLASAHEDMAKGQAERLMPLLSSLLDSAGVNWGDLSALGVGIGPGNFTGIRISVAAARGLALSNGIPALGVSLTEALAEGATGPVLALLDARREQVYAQIIGQEAAPQLLPLCQISQFYAKFDGTVIGHQAEQIAAELGCAAAPAAHAPGSAIARIAARRAGPETPRPAPLYVRSPDATPSSAPIPKLLDADPTGKDQTNGTAP